MKPFTVRKYRGLEKNVTSQLHSKVGAEEVSNIVNISFGETASSPGSEYAASTYICVGSRLERSSK